MAKKDKNSQNGKAASRKSVAKLAKTVDALSAKVAVLEGPGRPESGQGHSGGQKANAPQVGGTGHR